MLRKAILFSALFITVITFRVNIDVMINSGSMWNTILSVIAWVLWAVVIAGILFRAKESKTVFWWLSGILSVIMISNFVVFTKGAVSSAIASLLTIIALPSALPFLGISGGLTKLGTVDLLALEIPYLLFVAETLICRLLMKKKRAGQT